MAAAFRVSRFWVPLDVRVPSRSRPSKKRTQRHNYVLSSACKRMLHCSLSWAPAGLCCAWRLSVGSRIGIPAVSGLRRLAPTSCLSIRQLPAGCVWGIPSLAATDVKPAMLLSQAICEHRHLFRTAHRSCELRLDL